MSDVISSWLIWVLCAAPSSFMLLNSHCLVCVLYIHVERRVGGARSAYLNLLNIGPFLQIEEVVESFGAFFFLFFSRRCFCVPSVPGWVCCGRTGLRVAWPCTVSQYCGWTLWVPSYSCSCIDWSKSKLYSSLFSCVWNHSQHLQFFGGGWGGGGVNLSSVICWKTDFVLRRKPCLVENYCFGARRLKLLG